MPVYSDVAKDLHDIYTKNRIIIGTSASQQKPSARKKTIAVVGIALGDEGKGRLVDNRIQSLLKKKSTKHVYVVRFQGGNNAGHTIEKEGVKLALHLIPSGVFYKETIGIMDRGMFIHVEDLQTEVGYVEKAIGSLKNRLFLSDEAIFSSDLERAEEWLNRIKAGQAAGGTGRGVAPSYAHAIDRLGLKMFDFLSDGWTEKLGDQYDRYVKEFKAYGIDLKIVEVPDFLATIAAGSEKKRKVGSKKEFLSRLETARNWLVKRKMIINTFLVHKKIKNDSSIAILFEGAQATGLDPWIGTRPDVTSTNTSAYGIRDGTAFWQPFEVEKKVGVFKIPYTSSVGARRMPTHIDLPKDLKDLPKNPSLDQEWGAYVRETAHEYGTTTGRPRDINHLDLPFLSYNAKMSYIDVLEGTHLDIAREDTKIKVCTHYVNKKGEIVPYQPGLRYQRDITPIYIELPGWDGSLCKKAKKVTDLPLNARKYLSFIQKRMGLPIVGVTTGSLRDNIVYFEGY